MDHLPHIGKSRSCSEFDRSPSSGHGCQTRNLSHSNPSISIMKRSICVCYKLRRISNNVHVSPHLSPPPYILRDLFRVRIPNACGDERAAPLVHCPVYRRNGPYGRYNQRYGLNFTRRVVQGILFRLKLVVTSSRECTTMYPGFNWSIPRKAILVRLDRHSPPKQQLLERRGRVGLKTEKRPHIWFCMAGCAG